MPESEKVLKKEGKDDDGAQQKEATISLEEPPVGESRTVRATK